MTAADVKYAYDAKFTIQKIFFDQVFDGSNAKEYKIGGIFGLERTIRRIRRASDAGSAQGDV
ncbi:MAG: hypothetical protein WA234_02325, partial [Rectinemataceae bacterium]